MTVTPKAVANELRQVFSALSDIGIITYYNSVFESHSFVSWSTPGISNASFLQTRDNLTISGYLHWLETNQYSAVLEDGGLLQLSYSFRGHVVVGHRLAYVPCPVALDPSSRELIAEGLALGDVVQMQLGDLSNVYMKSTLRFDYDPATARVGHPAAHLTLNDSDCRIACVAPMRVGRFVSFVFQHFYANRYREHSYLRDLPVEGWFTREIVQDERKRIHLDWT